MIDHHLLGEPFLRDKGGQVCRHRVELGPGCPTENPPGNLPRTDRPLRVEGHADVGLAQPRLVRLDLVHEVRPPGLDVEQEQRLVPPRRLKVGADDLRTLPMPVQPVPSGVPVDDRGDQLEDREDGPPFRVCRTDFLDLLDPVVEIADAESGRAQGSSGRRRSPRAGMPGRSADRPEAAPAEASSGSGWASGWWLRVAWQWPTSASRPVSRRPRCSGSASRSGLTSAARGRHTCAGKGEGKRTADPRTPLPPRSRHDRHATWRRSAVVPRGEVCLSSGRGATTNRQLPQRPSHDQAGDASRACVRPLRVPLPAPTRLRRSLCAIEPLPVSSVLQPARCWPRRRWWSPLRRPTRRRAISSPTSVTALSPVSATPASSSVVEPRHFGS